jgi:hypothetical protein
MYFRVRDILQVILKGRLMPHGITLIESSLGERDWQ